MDTVRCMAEVTPAAPAADRPVLPTGYGVPTSARGLLAWPDVEQRLVAALHYWLATVRPDGTPHVVPRWGVWLEGRFWYDGAPTTRHARNLAANPACSLNLESGTEAIIVEGSSVPTRADAHGLGMRLAKAFEKYHDLGYSPSADSWSGEHGGGLSVLTPRRALAWFSFPKDCTRFRFEPAADPS
jgi:Pyridoxamine 5'-phosphate oxidase